MMNNVAKWARTCRADPHLVKWARIVAATMVAAALLDVVTTDLALKSGNMEANPLVSGLQQQLGPWWAIPKMTFHLLLAYFVLWLPSRRMLRLGGVVVAGYTLILINNLHLAGIFF